MLPLFPFLLALFSFLARRSGTRATIDNADFLQGDGTIFFALDMDHTLKDFHTLDDLSKNDMLSVQMRRSLQRDEELRAPRSWTALVGHADNPRLVMDTLQIFVGKTRTRSEGTVPACPIKFLKISRLHHEIGDDAMELASTVGGTGFRGRCGIRTGAQSCK